MESHSVREIAYFSHGIVVVVSLTGPEADNTSTYNSEFVVFDLSNVPAEYLSDKQASRVAEMQLSDHVKISIFGSCKIEYNVSTVFATVPLARKPPGYSKICVTAKVLDDPSMVAKIAAEASSSMAPVDFAKMPTKRIIDLLDPDLDSVVSRRSCDELQAVLDANPTVPPPMPSPRLMTKVYKKTHVDPKFITYINERYRERYVSEKPVDFSNHLTRCSRHGGLVFTVDDVVKYVFVDTANANGMISILDKPKKSFTPLHEESDISQFSMGCRTVSDEAFKQLASRFTIVWLTSAKA
uniref:Uncharacterized protein n=1 Tax=viral metagenome TaxID=1070528 RepID=A0A2V0RLT4_9ZZZZ